MLNLKKYYNIIKMCKFKKKLTQMVNVYGFSISVKEEEEDIPYTSSTTTIITTTTTTMNLSKSSHIIEKKHKLKLKKTQN